MSKFYDLLESLIGKVNKSVKTDAQTLTESQKAQARANIGAAAVGEGGGGGTVSGGTVSGDAVLYTAQSLTNAQKTQALKNIGAVSYESQTLTDAQKTQVRTNTNAASQEDVTNCMGNISLLTNGLKWGGNIEGRDTFTMHEGDGMKILLVHISDEVPALLELFPIAMCSIAGLETFDSLSNVATVELANMDGVYIGELDGLYIYVFLQDTSLGGYNWKKGIYVTIMRMVEDSLTIPYRYLENIYFYGHTFKQGGSSESGGGVTITDTLTWDGNIGSKYSVVVTEGEGEARLVKISSHVLTEADLSSGCAFGVTPYDGSEGGELSYTAEEALSSFGEDGSWISEGVFSIPTDNYTFNELTFAEKGIYFMSAESVYVSAFICPNAKFEIVSGGGGGGADMSEVKAYVDAAISEAIGEAIAASY